MGDQISPWFPEQDQVRLAILGKLIEECNELAARAARCIIHGIDETDPDSGRLNRDELVREMADVIACVKTAEIKLGVECDMRRVDKKFDGFRTWHALIVAGRDGHRSEA